VKDSKGEIQLQDLASASSLGLTPPFWIISDTHFGHRNIIGYTGRPDSAGNAIIEHWRDLVRSDDAVVHLGDLDFGHRRHGFDLEALATGLPGRIFLLHGNHDRHTAATYNRLGVVTIPPFVLPWRGGPWPSPTGRTQNSSILPAT